MGRATGNAALGKARERTGTMEWFLLNSGQVEGPFQAADLKEKFSSGGLDENVLVCRQGDPHWKPLSEFKEQILVDAKPDENLKDWILLNENLSLSPSPEQEGQYVQSGPYTTQDILNLIQSGQAKYSDYIWKSGLTNWLRINEVDEFFPGSKPMAEVEAPVIQNFIPPELPLRTSQATDEKDHDQHLDQVLEQTRLTEYDFVEDEKPPLEVNPIDATVMRPLVIPEVPVTKEQPQFVLSTASIDESRSEVPTAAPVTVRRESPQYYELATKYFPWLMTALAAILVLMVGMWALSLRQSEPVQSAQAPSPLPVKKKEAKPSELSRVEPARALETKAEIVADTGTPKKLNPPAPRQVKATAPKTVPTAHKGQLNLMAWRLLKKAERLDREFDMLRGRPADWEKFYQDWRLDFKKTTDVLSQHEAKTSPVLKQLQLGRGRLGQRAQMMDRSIMRSSPVSSDFEQEDLPGLFRNIQGQLRRR